MTCGAARTYGVGAAMSLGQDAGELPFQMRAETLPGAARFRTAGRGITMPEPGRTRLRTGSPPRRKARKAVQELAAQKVDIVKIWVDDRNGRYKKLTPELYGADHRRSAQERPPRHRAHLHARGRERTAARRGRRVRARRPRQGHGRRGAWRCSRQRPNVVRRAEPARPRRGDRSQLAARAACRPAELQKLQAAATDRPEAQTAFGIQARNLARLNAAGVRIALGTDGNTPWAPHVEMADMVAAGMTPAQVIVAATRNAARVPAAGRCRHGRGGQERGLHRPRREPARRHRQHAADRRGLSARRRDRSRRLPLEDRGDAHPVRTAVSWSRRRLDILGERA